MKPMATLAERFFERGWVAFEPDPGIAEWAGAVRPLAEAALEDPALRARWLRSGGTWFVGVHALGNDASGAVAERGVPPISGRAVAFVHEALELGHFAWDNAQISVCMPGYPQSDPQESEAAYRFRVKRDAAHVDGLLRDDGGRRYLGETHAFILGVPLARVAPCEAPFVVYEGSHEVMRRAFARRLDGIEPARWPDEDLTEAYTAARREAFDACRRVEIHVRPGEAYMVHRLALHGIAPWREPDGGSAPEARRMIAYFRPDAFPGEAPGWWLERR
ncbi:MAG TPA: hypothetical protein VMM55_10040 [Thermohalobaculum sp.]|nr:hypothetical protein [Thermohalobaculum sp.]